MRQRGNCCDNEPGGATGATNAFIDRVRVPQNLMPRSVQPAARGRDLLPAALEPTARPCAHVSPKFRGSSGCLAPNFFRGGHHHHHHRQRRALLLLPRVLLRMMLFSRIYLIAVIIMP